MSFKSSYCHFLDHVINNWFDVLWKCLIVSETKFVLKFNELLLQLRRFIQRNKSFLMWCTVLWYQQTGQASKLYQVWTHLSMTNLCVKTTVAVITQDVSTATQTSPRKRDAISRKLSSVAPIFSERTPNNPSAADAIFYCLPVEGAMSQTPFSSVSVTPLSLCDASPLCIHAPTEPTNISWPHKTINQLKLAMLMVGINYVATWQ